MKKIRRIIINNYVGKSIGANYIVKMESLGGKIHFEENGLTFKSHALNIQKREIIISYNNIKSISNRNTLGIVPNGILVVTNDGEEHKFVINNRNKVIEFLNSKV